MRLKAKSSRDILQKTQRLVQIKGASRLDIPLHHSLKTEIDRILSNCDLIWVNWKKDGVPLQDHALARMIATALTRAVRLGDELISGGGRRTRDSDPALQVNDRAGLEALRMVGDELETTATEITRAADSRATRFPGILRRLIKRCNREPEAKDKHRQWWEQILAHRPPELKPALEGLRVDISGRIQECWEKVDWLSQLDQAHRNVLAFEHKDIKFSIPRSKKSRAPEIAHISMEGVGRT